MPNMPDNVVFPRIERAKEDNPEGTIFYLHQKHRDPERFCTGVLNEKNRAGDGHFLGISVGHLRTMVRDFLQIEALEKDLKQARETQSGAAEKWGLIQDNFYELAKRTGVPNTIESVIPVILNMLDSRDLKIRDLQRTMQQIEKNRAADSSDLTYYREQVENLGKFIGHPGATAAHVVSETVSLIEKFLTVARRIGLSIGEETPVRVSEMFVNATSTGMWYPSPENQPPKSFEQELAGLINRHSLERAGGDTPDFILAEFLHGVLHAYGNTTDRRTRWYSAPLAEAVNMEGMPSEPVSLLHDPGCPVCNTDSGSTDPFEPFTEIFLARGDVRLRVEIGRNASDEHIDTVFNAFQRAVSRD